MSNNSLQSEKVIIAAPLSFTGSAQRIWRITDTHDKVLKYILVAVALGLILAAWSFVAAWYFMFGILLVPYRLLRRGSRKRKREELRHRELLEARQ